MKKLLFFILTLFVVTNVKIMADCSLVSKINEDILGGSVLSAVNSINLKGDIYCDKEGYYMVYYLQNNNCIVNGESIRKKYKYFNNNIYSQELSCNKSNLNNIKNTKDFFQLNGKFRYCLLISSGLKYNTTNLNKNIEIVYSCIGK